MTFNEVLTIIFDEKMKVDKLSSTTELTQWFLKVGFKDIKIDEDKKLIICTVSRPNQFISKFKKPIVNFLIHLSDHVFRSLGYSFELQKDTNDVCYAFLKQYIENKNRG